LHLVENVFFLFLNSVILTILLEKTKSLSSVESRIPG